MSELVEVVQLQDVGDALITLYEINLGNSTLYFHEGVNEDFSDIRFRDKTNPSTINTYAAIPINVDGIEANGDGAAARPTLTIANVLSLFRDALSAGGISSNDDLVSKILVRRQTLLKYLVGQPADSNPPVEFPSQKFVIDRVTALNNLFVTFELAASYDLEKVSIPGRVITGKYCSWIYQGVEAGKGGCSWRTNSVVETGIESHKAYFSINDEPIVPVGSFTAFSSSATINDYRSHSGRYWQCVKSTSTSPSSSSSDWREARAYTVWDNSTDYDKNSDNPEQSDYVEYSNTIWTCTRSHSDETPSNNSTFWSRGDLCGKILQSCKNRFQYVAVDGSGDNRLPRVTVNTQRTLPFGAFPGSDKFR